MSAELPSAQPRPLFHAALHPTCLAQSWPWFCLSESAWAAVTAYHMAFFLTILAAEKSEMKMPTGPSSLLADNPLLVCIHMAGRGGWAERGRFWLFFLLLEEH